MTLTNDEDVALVDDGGRLNLQQHLLDGKDALSAQSLVTPLAGQPQQGNSLPSTYPQLVLDLPSIHVVARHKVVEGRGLIVGGLDLVGHDDIVLQTPPRLVEHKDVLKLNCEAICPREPTQPHLTFPRLGVSLLKTMSSSETWNGINISAMIVVLS